MLVKDEDQRIVAVCGDWHGNVRWVMSVLDELARLGVTRVFHVGDFGLWPGEGGQHYLKAVAGKCAKYKMSLWITPGNHEDYDQIEDPEDPDGGVARQIIAYGSDWEIALLPRGFTWEEGGRKIVSLGGAPSIDFQHRTLGRSWWKEEMIRESDLERLSGRAEGADIMLCHDAPDGGTEVVQDIIDTPPHLSMWSDTGLDYAKEGRMLMNKAVGFVNPKMFIHGHYHAKGMRVDSELDRTYVSLNCDGMVGNVILLDLKTMEVLWV